MTDEQEPLPTDPSTGMPALPDGFRWKVKIAYDSYHRHPILSIKLKQGVWTRAESSPILERNDPRDYDEEGNPTPYRETKYEQVYIDPEEYPDLILGTAQGVYRKYEKYLRAAVQTAKVEAAAKKFNGYYPPKKLEQKNDD